jgi:hypothetical protein
MEEGDRVTCLGDGWMKAGVSGTIRSIRNTGSIEVLWDTKKDGSTPGPSLYHGSAVLMPDSISQTDPNFLFKLQRRKKR